MNSLINQAKAQRAEEDKSSLEKNNPNDASVTKTSNPATLTEKNHLGFVKVNMDGVGIGRKVDLNSHSSYETLAQTLEDMFFRPAAIATNPTGKFFFFFLNSFSKQVVLQLNMNFVIKD